MTDHHASLDGYSGLSILNGERITLPGPQLLHQLVSTDVSNEIAIYHFGGNQMPQEISYTQLRKHVRRLAKNLFAQCRGNLGAQRIVPVMVPQCPELYISYLAVLEMGAAFCPVSPDVPLERLKFIAEDVNANLILTLHDQCDKIQQILPNIKCIPLSFTMLINGQEAMGETCCFSRLPKSDADDTAYVMYTSGSTGLPKGVKVSHRSVTQSLMAHNEHIPNFNRFLQFASPTFDVSVFEIFFPFFRGATLVCCEREAMLADLPGIVRTLHIDAVELTPTVASTLLRSRKAVPRLKILLTIGEMLNRHVVDEFGGSDEQESILYAMYGPTEAAIHCTIAPRLSASSSVKSIGVPLSTVTSFILTEAHGSKGAEILPVGQVGELAIAGQLASGYLNRPDQTSAAFVDLPGFGQVYRTGDRAVMPNSHEIHILGRMSVGQVKLRGQRIELGEIEEVACKTAAVEVAVASIIDEALVLFCSGSDMLSTEGVEAICKSWLPSFMRPTEIVLLPEIPRLPSGKIDRKALDEKQRQRLGRDFPYSGTFANVTERKIVTALQHELNISIGPESSLRSCGLDSLRAIKIVTSLRPLFPNISVLMLLEADTVRDLAGALTAKIGSGTVIEPASPYEDSEEWQELAAVIRGNLKMDGWDDLVANITPCTSLQIAMLGETSTDETLNFNTIELEIVNQIDIDDVRAALRQIALHNEVLRSGFVSTAMYDVPFVQVIWSELHSGYDPSLLHPLQIMSGHDNSHIRVKIHHALYDGWSWDLVMSDLNDLFAHRHVCRRPSFQDYRLFMEVNAPIHAQIDRDYWTENMREARPMLLPNLRGDRSQSVGRRSCTRTLRTKSRVFDEVAAKCHTSRQTILQAALVLLLSVYCDNADVVCGIVSSGREKSFPGIEQMIGPCLSTYPLRVDLSSVSTTRDLLLYVHRQQIACLKHGSLTLSQIQQLANVKPTECLFDVLCVWQEGLKTTSASALAVTTDTTDALSHTLVLEAEPKAEQVLAKLSFDTAKIPYQQAELMLEQLDSLVAFLTREDSTQLNRSWTSMKSNALSVVEASPAALDHDFDLSSTIAQLADQDPERVAIEMVHNFDPDTKHRDIETLTYRSLNMRARGIARNLVDMYHVRPDDLVCVMLGKSMDLYICILAVILAGAGYICIDPRSPSHRIKQILNEAECGLVITNDLESVAICKRSTSMEIITPGSLYDASKLTTALPLRVPRNALAYAVFTSGSTGTPKGVLLTRKNLLSHINQVSKLYPHQSKDAKLLQACSQAFDVSVFEIFWTWHAGMTLCSASNDILFRDIEKFIDTSLITHLSLTPSVAALINPTKVPRVGFLVTAGEPMNSKVFHSWSNCGLFQGYGPSETTNICNVRPWVSSDDKSNNTGPAFANTSLYVCKRQEGKRIAGSPVALQVADFIPVPKGAVGEIWVGGEQVGRGYIDADLTARSFLDHPQHGWLYRSGDIGRLLADNSLVILGREDGQVKLRGQRIELGDIDSAFVQHELIHDAVTLVMEKSTNAKLITVYVLQQGPGSASTDNPNATLYEWLQQRLPDYMIPDILLAVDAIPLTRQGKVDHRAISHMHHEMTVEDRQRLSKGNVANGDRHAPMSEAEVQIAQILSDVTRTPLSDISPTSSFFGMGLDSISSIRFAQTLRQRGFGLVDVSIILKNHSISRLIAYLKGCGGNSMLSLTTQDSAKGLYDISWQDSIRSEYQHHGYQVDKILPCTPLQEAMLASSHLSRSETYYNAITFHVHCAIEALRATWTKMVERHDLLRTAFVESPDLERPYAQLVLCEYQPSWTETSEAVKVDIDTATLPIPPYHFQLIPKDDQDRTLLTLSIHHALYDAEAMTLLLRDVEQTVSSHILPAPVPFGKYLNYMVDLKEEKIDAFWSPLLKNVKPSRLERVFSSSTRTADRSGAVRLEARISLDVLESRAKCSEITLLSLLQTTLARLLSCYIQSGDICLGSVLNGRGLAVEGVQNIVGPCFNTLPLRVRIGKHTSVKALCQQLHQDTLDMLPFQPSSLRRIQKQHSPDGKALFDTMLLMQQEPLALDHTVWSFIQERGDMGFPYIFEVIPHISGNKLELVLNCQHYDHGLMSRLLEHFDALLEHTAIFPQALASDFTMIQASLPELKSHAELTKGHHMSDNVGDSANPCPWSATELKVKNVLCSMTMIEESKVKLSTTIFRLGLDSISAVQIASRLRKLSLRISTANILEAPSIREIAASCDSASRDNQENTSGGTRAFYDLDTFYRENRDRVMMQLHVGDEAVEDILPCTATQCGILTQFVKSQGRLYYNRTTLTLHQQVDIAKLQQAWGRLIQRHSILRTGFVQLDDAKHPFAMVVYASGVHQVPWKEATKEDLELHSERIVDHLEYPGWQITVSGNNDKRIMDIWMLHALYDATSLRIMLEDVATIYEDNQIPPAVSWRPALSRVIHLAHSDDEAKRFWLDAGSFMETTKFPDMNIYYTKDQRLYTTIQASSVSQRDIRKQCAQLNVSLQPVCQAAWARLLAAYTGQSKVTFGTILSGRESDNEDEYNIAFPCINTVPFAIEVEKDSATFLRNVSRRNAGCRRYQYTPLNTIKRMNTIAGDLFDTVLVLQKLESTETESSLWTIGDDEASAEYAISLEIVPEKNGQTQLRLTSRRSVVPEAQAEIILREYDRLLVEELSLAVDALGSSNQCQSPLLSVLPPHDDPIPTKISFLHQFVTGTTKMYPNKVALEFVLDVAGAKVEKQSWSYTELDTRGNQYANLLVKHGVKVGDLVAVCFDKCPEASFAILGVLKAGCAYVAIDPGAPKARKTFILDDATCKFVLTTPDKASDFDHEDVLVLASHEEATFLDIPCEAPVLDDKLTGDHTCYCLYTSGTTGTPKGCLISHRSAVQAMMSFQRIFEGRWTEESRWLQFASFHFDVSVLEQYWSWSVGICVTSAPRDLLFEDLPGVINKLGITHLDLTPSLARLLTPEEVPSLCDGVFIVGGEQVRQDVLDTWSDIGCLYNFYGPSEVTIGCTVHPQVRKHAKPTNIGQQWPNVGTFVLEPYTPRPVIRGAIGELCLSGSLVGKGYLNRPELTLEKFTVIEAYNIRVYRTGDLVRLLHDDSFEFLGRIDDQVKLRGQRLEIGEINHVLVNADDRVKDVSTLVLSHPEQEKEQLVAFFTTSSKTPQRHAKPALRFEKQSKIIAEQLKVTCTKHLPPYMIPTYFMDISFLPLSINNKTDNKALKAIYREASIRQIQREDRTEPAPSVVIPSSFGDISQILASFFNLNTSSIQPTSRLFELGLDSISVIALSRIMRRKGFAGADISTIMGSSSVLNLAKAVQDLDSKDPSDVEISEAKVRIKKFATKHHDTIIRTLNISTSNIEHIAPCTSLQAGMISKVMNSNRENIPYFTSFTYRLDNDVDIIRLQNAWKRAADCTDVLRTYFVSSEDGYAQVVLKETKIHSMHLLGSTRPSDLAHTFAEWVAGVKDFEKSLPWQICFTQGEEQEQEMSLFLFHGLYDGSSLPSLLKTVANEYEGTHESRNLVPTFHDVLAYGPLRVQKGAKKFWQGQIAEVNLLDIKASSSGPSNTPSRATFTLQLKSIQKLCTRLDVTRSAVFHAAWLYSLQEHYAVNPTIGVVLSGRALEVDGADSVIGPLFNTVPYSINKSPKVTTLHSLIKACHKFNISVLSYQHTSIRDISKWLGVSTEMGLFDSLFVFQNDTISSQSSAFQLWTEVRSDSVPDYPLNLEVRQTEDARYTVTAVTVENERFQSQNISKLLNFFISTLEGLNRGDDFKLRHDLPRRQPNHLSETNDIELRMDVNQDDCTWTDLTFRIRSELADLAGVEESEVSLQRPSIFELGLDSIDALKLAARLKKADITIPVSKIMRFPTVSGMAAYIDNPPRQKSSHPATSEALCIGQGAWKTTCAKQGTATDGIEIGLTVTPMQEGLLLDFERYYHVLIYKISEATDTRKLSDAIFKVIRQLPVLRSTFITVDDTQNSASFLQLVRNETDSEFTFSHIDQHANVREAANELRNQANSDKLSGQRFKAVIADTRNEPRMLFLSMPHALYDGWSLQLIHNRIRDTYHGNDQPIQSASRISDHVKTTMEQASSQANKDFWLQVLQSAHPALARVSNELEHPHSSLLLQQASKVPLNKTSKLCKDTGITLQSLGLACWTSVLARHAQSLDVIFGIVLSGRTTDGSEELVFPTFNTVCFRNRLSTESSRIKMLRETHERILQVTEHQHFPLKEALKLSGYPQKHLFNTLFTFQKSPTNIAKGDALYEEYDIDESPSEPPYAINVEMTEKDGKLWWTVAVQRNIANSTQVQNIIHQLDQVLGAFCEAPHEPFLQRFDLGTAVCTLGPVVLRDQSSRMQQISLSSSNEAEEPFTNMELVIRDALAQVSRTEPTTIKKSIGLFHLGLDSISAIKVVGLLRKEGIKLPVSDLVSAQTIKEMAKAARKQDLTGNVVETRPTTLYLKQLEGLFSSDAAIQKDTIEIIFPASAGQVYMLDMWQSSKGKLFYANFWFELQNTLPERLPTAFVALQKQVPALRTTFVNHQGQVYAIVLKPTTNVMTVNLPWAYEVLEDKGKLLVCLKIHHALYDAISLHLMVSALQELCHDHRLILHLNTNSQPFLELVQSTNSLAVDQQRHFWTKYLSVEGRCAGKLALTGSFTRPRVEKFVPNLMSLDRLRSIIKRKGIGMQALFFAAYARMHAEIMMRHSGSHTTPTERPDHVKLGIYLANRSLDLDDLPSLLAPTFNIVPLKVNVNEAYSLVEVARQIRVDLQEISKPEYCGTSMRNIFDWTGTRIDAFVNFLKMPDEANEQAVFEDHAINFKHAEGDTLQRAKTAFEQIKNKKHASPFFIDNQSTISGTRQNNPSESEWCTPAIDIEARITNGHELAMGVFAPDDMLDEDGVDMILQGMKDLLDSVQD